MRIHQHFLCFTRIGNNKCSGQETGDEYFSPETVEHIQNCIKEGRKPDRMIETAVYNYA
jgi:hypothetical protein